MRSPSKATYHLLADWRVYYSLNTCPKFDLPQRFPLEASVGLFSTTIHSKGNMMFRTMITSAAVMMALGGAVAAGTFEVKMLNKGDGGAMIFEPASLRVAVGDTVKFVSADKGHNAETVKGMIPESAEPFKGKVNEEIEVILTEIGFYGVKCKPHWGMGMVMVIAVGDEAADADSFLAGKMPKKAKARFEESLSGL
jgi:pseudoazurin